MDMNRRIGRNRLTRREFLAVGGVLLVSLAAVRTTLRAPVLAALRGD